MREIKAKEGEITSFLNEKKYCQDFLLAIKNTKEGIDSFFFEKKRSVSEIIEGIYQSTFSFNSDVREKSRCLKNQLAKFVDEKKKEIEKMEKEYYLLKKRNEHTDEVITLSQNDSNYLPHPVETECERVGDGNSNLDLETSAHNLSPLESSFSVPMEDDCFEEEQNEERSLLEIGGVLFTPSQIKVANNLFEKERS